MISNHSTVDAFVASLFSTRFGFHIAPRGMFARFSRGRMIDASPDVARRFGLMSAHFEQVGF